MNLNAPRTPNMYRENIKLGMVVDVVLKKDQRTGKRTRGKVMWILTSAAFHSRGIKVTLDNRQVGRVQEIIGTEE
ncbi:MAG TPA: YwbE family protein [Bacteroidia bacterium]|nr:YwbE family protein [Bacteroidia bacterium]